MVLFIRNRGNTSLFLLCFSLVVLLPSSLLWADLLDEDAGALPPLQTAPKEMKEKERGPVDPPRKAALTLPEKRVPSKEAGVAPKASGKSREKMSSENSGEQRNLPVHFRGEGLIGSRKKGYLELQKDVFVSQGDLTLNSDYAQVYYEDKSREVKKIIAKGRVTVQRPAAGDRALLKAKSDEIEFDVLKQKLVLQGHAELAKDGDLVKGERIHYDIKTGWIDASQVKGVLKP